MSVQYPDLTDYLAVAGAVTGLDDQTLLTATKEIQLTVHLTKERREITSPTKNPRQCGGTTSTNSLSLLAR